MLPLIKIISDLSGSEEEGFNLFLTKVGACMQSGNMSHEKNNSILQKVRMDSY